MDKSDKTYRILSAVMKEARHSMDHEDFEEAVPKLQRCLQLEDEPEGRAAILDDLGYCSLRLGWFEEAVKIYSEYLTILPSNNDGRFYLASACASLGWKNDAIRELKAILTSDPDDVLARHGLALCYRNMGWMKESLEEMRKADACAAKYGSPDEKEIVESSLAHLEEEIDSGDDDSTKIISFLILLALAAKRSRPRKKM